MALACDSFDQLEQLLLPARVQAAFGILCFLSVICGASTNLRAVSWRTVGWGMALQLLLALFILKFEVGGYRPGYELFSVIAGVIRSFLDFSQAGGRFVFGVLADQPTLEKAFPNNGFVFAFVALPTIISPAHLARIAAADTPASRLLSDVAKAAIASYLPLYGDEGGARFNDLPTVAYVVDPTLFRSERHPVAIETTGTYTTGMTVVDWRRDLGLPANTDVLMGVDVPRLVEMFADRLSRR